jgi:cyanophycin synthetase
LGIIAARHFDEIIIRMDKNLRGRTEEEIVTLLKDGIQAEDSAMPLQIISEEEQSVMYAYEHCPEGSLIFVMCDKVATTVELVKSIKEKEDETFSKMKITGLSAINS